MSSEDIENKTDPIGETQDMSEVFRKGVNLATAGVYQEALIAFDTFLATHPRDAAALYNKAFVLMNLGRAEEAKANARRFIEIAPSKLSAYVAIAEQNIQQLEVIPKRKKWAIMLLMYGLIGVLSYCVVLGILDTMGYIAEADAVTPAKSSVLADLIMILWTFLGLFGGSIAFVWGGIWLYRLRNKTKYLTTVSIIQTSSTEDRTVPTNAIYSSASTSGGMAAPSPIYSPTPYSPPSSPESDWVKKVGAFVGTFIFVFILISVVRSGDVTIFTIGLSISAGISAASSVGNN